jgi:branched-subunit amino acid aminotransferase/4-amino-4-deoxychorismate lyase
MANVFAVFEGELVTPHPSTGARPGLIREWVMQRYTGSKIVQRALTWGDLDRVTECFLTSSWNGVVPVTSLDARPLQTTVAEALKAEFWAEEFELRALP